MCTRKTYVKNKHCINALTAALLITAIIQPYCVSAAENQSNTAFQTEIYVSPEGSDMGRGTIDDPLSTVSAARDMLRTISDK